MHYDPHWGNNDKNRGRFVRDKRYKLYLDGRFYDLVKDPKEQHPRYFQDLNPKEKQEWKKLNTVLKKLPVWK